LISQKKKPLSHEGISYYFKVINNALPLNAKNLLSSKNNKEKIEPHDLRHTSAVIKINQFYKKYKSIDVALQDMRVFFGWEKNSNMPLRYARAFFEERIFNTFSDIFDDSVEALRSIPE